MADESRIENILDATLGEPGAEVPSPPFSRIEEKLIELKEAIESGEGESYTKTETDTLLAGKADLTDGKVPASQLPSYVDDVLEYESVNSFPVIGETGKIYVATDTNKTYRWSGSGYVEISESLALGETASTAYAGDKGKANADAIAKKPGEITTGKQYTIDGQTVTAGTGAEAFNSLANNKASGVYSHAEGAATTASGTQSHAEGAGTTASGGQSHAEGAVTTASGTQSHAEGSYTNASGNQSHVEGNGTTASGTQSHAEGGGTTASGAQSHAEGGGTTASGNQSHAEGNGTKASSANQHAQGKFNVEDSNDTYAFIIGNGTTYDDRHNAFAIDWNGLIYVNGAATGVDVSALAPQATTYTKTEVDTALAGKVDKETGKGLSANDFTDTDKAKLDGIESGAEANVQADWAQTDTTADDYIKNKPTIPSPATVDQTYSAASTNAQSGVAVAQAISTKADLSIFTPMTQAQYDALVTKTAPLYFIYEDGEST